MFAKLLWSTTNYLWGVVNTVRYFNLQQKFLWYFVVDVALIFVHTVEPDVINKSVYMTRGFIVKIMQSLCKPDTVSHPNLHSETESLIRLIKPLSPGNWTRFRWLGFRLLGAITIWYALPIQITDGPSEADSLLYIQHYTPKLTVEYLKI